MEIAIYRKNSEDLWEINKIRWRLLNGRNMKLFILYAVVGVIFCIGSALILKDGESFWGIGPSAGFSLIVLSFFYFSHTSKNKKIFLKSTQDYINRAHKYGEGASITITDSFVSYKDFESYYEIKWTMFSHYSFKDGYLFLFTNKHIIFWMKRVEVSAEEFDELRLFLTKTMTEKK